jgi:hypothetical protein
MSYQPPSRKDDTTKTQWTNVKDIKKNKNDKKLLSKDNNTNTYILRTYSEADAQNVRKQFNEMKVRNFNE